ncbi:MAG: hypothetical protein JEZ04_05815 [Spirochaetales bacterium]|nr:hypothetical protein [Spirochaetales bacterium]
MQKEITIKEFVSELVRRIDSDKGIDCCREEIKRLAELAGRKCPDEKILVTWKD